MAERGVWGGGWGREFGGRTGLSPRSIPVSPWHPGVLCGTVYDTELVTHRWWNSLKQLLVPSFLARIFKGDYTAPTDEVESYTEQYNP